MIFSYLRIDKTGKTYKELIEAESLEIAKQKLFQKGIWYKNLKIKNSHLFFQTINFFQKKISYKLLIQISRNLSIYLKAGIPLLKSISLIKNQQSNKQVIYFLENIGNRLEEGESFYNALSSQNTFVLPEFYKYSLKVAEESGTLQNILEELAHYLYSLDSIQKRITQALMYPSFILGFSILMISFMLSVVVPKITTIFISMHQEMPLITRFVIKLGDFFGAYWMWLIIVLCAIIFSTKQMYQKNNRFRTFTDQFCLYIPVYNKILISWELARFTHIASILVHAGLTFVEAIKLATNTLSNTIIKKQFEHATKDVVEGKKFSQALLSNGFSVDPSFLQAIAVGEETSEIEAILKNLSEFYLEENNDQITVFLSLFEPILILIVGGIIGLIVASMLLPIFSINFGNL